MEVAQADAEAERICNKKKKEGRNCNSSQNHKWKTAYEDGEGHKATKKTKKKTEVSNCDDFCRFTVREGKRRKTERVRVVSPYFAKPRMDNHENRKRKNKNKIIITKEESKGVIVVSPYFQFPKSDQDHHQSITKKKREVDVDFDFEHCNAENHQSKKKKTTSKRRKGNNDVFKVGVADSGMVVDNNTVNLNLEENANKTEKEKKRKRKKNHEAETSYSSCIPEPPNAACFEDSNALVNVLVSEDKRKHHDTRQQQQKEDKNDKDSTNANPSSSYATESRTCLEDVLSPYAYNGNGTTNNFGVNQNHSIPKPCKLVVKNDDDMTEIRKEQIGSPTSEKVHCQVPLHSIPGIFEEEMQQIGKASSKTRKKNEDSHCQSHVEVRKVSPYFHASTGQRVAMNERQKTKIKPPKPCQKSCPTLAKFSPYFLKPSEEGEAVVCNLAGSKAGHKKLSNELKKKEEKEKKKKKRNKNHEAVIAAETPLSYIPQPLNAAFFQDSNAHVNVLMSGDKVKNHSPTQLQQKEDKSDKHHPTNLNPSCSHATEKRPCLEDVLSLYTHTANSTANNFGVNQNQSIPKPCKLVVNNDDVKEIRNEPDEEIQNQVPLHSTPGIFEEEEEEMQQIANASTSRKKNDDPHYRPHVEVYKVSPYFHASTGQKVAMNERQGTKIKPPKPCQKPCPSTAKVSPYFPKPAKEGAVVCSLADSKAGHKKLQKECKKSVSLSPSQKLDEAYQRKTPDNTWKPPRSEVGLLQEDHACDPWRVLVICMLLNRTTGLQARRVVADLFALCPNAKAATEVATEEIEKVIQSLGLQKKRAVMIQRFSLEYLGEDWTHVTQLHGIGKYAADAYAIFCTGKWDRVEPADHMLNYYWEFLCNITKTSS